jgi:transcriptional regulator with XRE-family HTH domain
MPEAQRERLPYSREEIARRLCLTRTALGFKQGEFAVRAGLTASAYNRYERATRVPAIEQAIKLCD